MNAQQLVEKLETAIYDAKLNAAREALAEIFNDGVNRGKVEHNDKQISDLETAVTLRDREIARLQEQVQQYRELSNQRQTIAYNRQLEIDKQEKQIKQLEGEIRSFRETNTLRNSQINKLNNTLEESMRNNAALKEQLVKNEGLKIEIYDAAFLHGYTAGKEAANRQTTAGGSLTSDPA